MMNDKKYLETLLRKLRNGTMTSEETEYLRACMEKPGIESEIKRLMDEHWKAMEREQEDPDEEDDPFKDPFSLN